jgi:crotonobetainyl-CoA:carnitine CoA-transferase CaiB-like acyl-CoA transferase
METKSMARPFEGIKVLDATHVLAGPYCGYQLALLGAETIKIENPNDPDPVRTRGPVAALNEAGLGFNFLTQNGNKKSLSLDLKTEQGRKIFLQLASKADVVIENFRTGAFDSMGFGYEALNAINHRVIYCSITAFGQNGPQATRTGYDPVIQGISGVMVAGGTVETGPMKAGAPFIDYATGMTAAYAVAAALYQRSMTGQGQRIDCAMLDVSLAFMGPAAMSGAYEGKKDPIPREAGTDIYRAKDGWIQLGAYNFRQNERLWTSLGNPEFASYRSWPEVWRNAPRMRSALTDLFLTRTADEWEAHLIGISVPGCRVRTIEEAMKLDQIASRETWTKLPSIEGYEGISAPGAPFRFEHDGPSLETAAPRLGEHNAEILAKLGYSPDQINELRLSAVI